MIKFKQYKRAKRRKHKNEFSEQGTTMSNRVTQKLYGKQRKLGCCKGFSAYSIADARLFTANDAILTIHIKFYTTLVLPVTKTRGHVLIVGDELQVKRYKELRLIAKRQLNSGKKSASF